MKKIITFILGIILIIFCIILGIQLNCEFNNTTKNNLLDMSSDIIAFTLDGESLDSMPNKDSGYIIKSISCENGSILTWDNTNWLIEVEKLESEDSCNVDFTNSLDSSIPMVSIIADNTTVSGSSNFSYTGSVQTFTISSTGTYTLEVWGAEGGIGNPSANIGGKGGYSKGDIYLTSGTKLYVYVGQAGSKEVESSTFGGGGAGEASSTYNSGQGGGASDIRINTDSLYSRVIVAGGGGGGAGANETTYIGGYGGGVNGGGATTNSSGASSNVVTGGSLTSAGTSTNNGSYTGLDGAFGTGGSYSGGGFRSGGAGGGGWYGGAAGSYGNAGGGGSGYVYTSSTASNYPSGCLLNSSYYLTNAQTIAGNSSFPTTSGTSTETGHSGNGYAKISYDITPPDYTTYFDSKSKTTTNGGKVTFYATSDIVSVTGCDNQIIESRKFVVSNVTGNVTCTVKTK